MSRKSFFLYFVRCLLCFALLFFTARFNPKRQARRRKTLIWSIITLYPIIVYFFEDKQLLLFTSNLSVLLHLLVSESLLEAGLGHVAHSFVSYLTLFYSKNEHQSTAIGLIGWKIEFFTSLLWLFVYKIIQDKTLVIEESKNLLIIQIQRLENKVSDLDSALQDKENFILSFSHEFKNLLNVLLGNLNLVAKVNYPPIHKLVQATLLSGEVMRLMVLNVLDTGKHQNTANLEIKPQRIHLPSLLENIWSLCAEIITTNDRLSGKLLLSTQMPHFLRLDPQRMLQVFLNLVSNAVKFTERGSVVIKIQWEETKPTHSNKGFTLALHSTADQLGSEYDPTSFDDDMTREKLDDEKINIYQSVTFLQPDQGFYEMNLRKREWTEDFGRQSQNPGTRGLLKVSVHDTGCGMSEAQRERLFSRFSQVSEDESKRQLGSGLGLWITKQIIEQHRGVIGVESKEGTGTKFEFSIPTVVEDSVDSPSIVIPYDASSAAESRVFSPTKVNLTRRTLSQINSARNNLIKLTACSDVQIPERQGSLRIELQEERLPSATSIDTPMVKRNAGSMIIHSFTHAITQMKILVADDNIFNLELMKKFITAIAGPNRTLFVKNSEEVHNLIESPDLAEIKLALIDKNLGDTDGLAVAKRIKETAAARGCENIVCYLVSGESSDVLEQDLASNEHFEGYLTKPIEFNELEKIIAEHYLSQ